ncbi:MAG: FAD-dependent oxidoreductase [Desulfobacterales bacterium]|nr:FAD-dependent oxidoreductase [Desulfobacterales bacterium]
MKLVIIGGVAGGATSAARARRLNEFADIVMFERGEDISFANCGLPYYLGKVIPARDYLLVSDAEEFWDRYRIQVKTRCEVTAIDRAKKEVVVTNLNTGESFREPYDKLILSPGAEPTTPPISGIDLPSIYRVRTIPDIDRIKTYVDQHKPKHAVVVGGGFIGLEMAENLVHRGVQTTIIEMMNQVMAPLDFDMSSILLGHLESKNVTCLLNTRVEGFSEVNGQTKVRLSDHSEIACDMVILSIGVRPEVKLAQKAGLALGMKGGIKVNSTMQTSDPDIYAVGDVVEILDRITQRHMLLPLAGPANKQARIAADNVMGRRAVYKGAIGTSIVKVFDLTVANTGLNEKILKEMDIPYLVNMTHQASNATYYPGSQLMSIKLIFSPGTGNILGAQLVGIKGVDKRIDVLATAIRGGLTVFDLEELELAYAPPYSSAKDPVNTAGFVASNILKSDISIVTWKDFLEIDRCTHTIIDVREKEELQKFGMIPGADHIPLADIRSHIEKLDKNQYYIIYCAIGLRAYIACRILTQHGFKCRSLSGGYLTYSSVMQALSKSQ